MLRIVRTLLASKTTGSNAKNQRGSPKRIAKQFNVFINSPVSPCEKLKQQRHQYASIKYSRLPTVHAGRNVRLDPRDYSLYATTKGIMTLRKSRINPQYSWLDVQPDIAKVYRTNEMRSALESRGVASQMVQRNEHYRPQFDLLRQPHWRERVMSTPKPTKRFIDPNLFTRGIVSSLNVNDRFSYE